MPEPITAVATAAGAGISALGANSAARTQADAAQRAAEAQAAAQREAIALQKQIHEENTARFQPFYDEGRRGQEAYLYELGLGEQPQGWNALSMTPQAEFALREGVQDVEAGASYGGGLYSGRTMEALERYRQGLATQDRDNQLNRLAALGSQGQSAAAQQGAQGQFYVQGVSNALGNIGNAQAAGEIGRGNALAAGTIGVGNAINSGIGNALGAYQYQQMLDRFPAPGAQPSGFTPTQSAWAPAAGRVSTMGTMPTPNVWPQQPMGRAGMGSMGNVGFGY
jgi:type II secretory pathway pseudopilin PulG